MAENIVVYTVRINTENGKIKIDGLTKGFVQADSAAKKLIATTGSLDKSVQDFNSAAGLAGATVNELGRFISDLPYGITAVTNNISQLGSLFSVLVSKASQVNNGLGTLKNTVALLKKEIMGPLGLLLLFQGAVALLETFASNSKKAADEANKLNKALGSAGGQIAILNTYKDVIDDATSSTEQQESALKSLKKEGYDPLIGTLEEFLEAKAKILLFDATKSIIQQEISDAITEQRDIENQIKALDEKIIERTNTLDQLRTGSGAGVGGTAIGGLIDKGALESDLQNLKDAKDTIISTQTSLTKELKEKYLSLVEDLEENDFICILFGTCKKKNANDLSKAMIDASKKRLAAFEDELKAIQALIDEYSGKLFDKAEKEEPIRFFDYDFDDLDVDIAIDELLDKNKKADQARIDSVNRMADAAQAFGDILSGIAGIMDAEFEKQMDVEQNKTTAINNELRKRLADEKLSADERKNIQSTIAANDEQLRLKQEAIAKKRFKTEKAMRISIGLADTAASALKAYGSQLIIGDPSSFIRAKVAAGLATALGLAQVAMISKQQFIGSASANPPGVGGSNINGGQVQAPDFNIVGASQARQLADVVEGQLNRPIKTYVVSSDVSTAQSLERNIVEGASI